MTCATVSVPPVPVPVTPVTTSRNKLDPARQLLRWAKSMRSCQGGPVAAQGARPLAPRHPPGKPPRCPVCPPLRPARPTPVPPLSRLVAPVRAHLAARTSRPVCRFLRRFRLTPRNPRETAVGSNPSPPTEEERTWLCSLASSGTTTLRLGLART